jgi:hypothetical protein
MYFWQFVLSFLAKKAGLLISADGHPLLLLEANKINLAGQGEGRKSILKQIIQNEVARI